MSWVIMSWVSLWSMKYEYLCLVDSFEIMIMTNLANLSQCCYGNRSTFNLYTH